MKIKFSLSQIITIYELVLEIINGTWLTFVKLPSTYLDIKLSDQIDNSFQSVNCLNV